MSKRKMGPKEREQRAQRAAQAASEPEFSTDLHTAAAAVDAKAEKAKEAKQPAAERPDYGSLEQDLFSRVAEEVEGAKVSPNKSGTYTRVLSADGAVLAYIWVSTRQGVLVDVYATKVVKGAKAARGRARKEGKVVTVAKPGEIAKAIDGIRVAQTERAEAVAV